MKKQRKSNKPRKQNKAAPVTATPTRRSFMASAPYVVGGIVAIGGLQQKE